MDVPLSFAFRSAADAFLGRLTVLAGTLALFGVLLGLVAFTTSVPRVAAIPPPLLDCRLQAAACDARLPLWFGGAVPRHPERLDRPPTHAQSDLLYSGRPADERRLRADLHRIVEAEQQQRHADWRRARADRRLVLVGRLAGLLAVVLGLLAAWVVQRHRTRQRSLAVVYRHRVALGGRVVHFADLAEGDASLLTRRFVGDREGDAAGLRRAMLDRIPAGRATRAISEQDRQRLEGLRS